MSSQPTPGWSWPRDFGTTSSHHEEPLPGTFTDDEPQVPRQPTEQPTHNPTETPPQEPEESAARARKPQKHYGPRTCRICLEVVQPTFEPPTEGFAFLNPTPKVSYVSEDPESGQLIRPCKCKGSQRYCHEGCLQAWRHADPSYRSKNHWECPTCKTKYSLERIKWSRWISSTFMQLLLTISILVFAIFILGFVGDTIINLYLDPYSTITSGGQTLPIFPEDNGGGWTRHFLKGTTSLGLLGFVKVFFTNPWLNIRTMIFGPRVRRGNNGRDRLEDISWTLIIIGVLTFLAATFNWVRAWSRRTLEKAGERVLDVQGDDDDDDED